MPRGPQKRRGSPAERRQSLLCRCKPKCLKLNAETGQYEGHGQYVSPKTRAVHRRDERLLGLLERGAGGRVTIPNSPADGGDNDDDDEDSYQEKWEILIGAYLDLLQEIPVFSGSHALEFVNDPRTGGPYQYDYPPELGGEDLALLDTSPNTGIHALDARVSHNRLYIERESALWDICRTLQSLARTPRTVELQGDAYEALALLEGEKAFQWETRRGENTTGPYFNTEIFYRKRQIRSKTFDVASLVCLILQFQYFLPRRGCEVHLSGASDVLTACHSSSTSTTPEVPLDPRPLAARFNLDPITTTYVACPQCHCLYPYGIGDEVPDHCTFKQAPTSQMCGADLWKRVERGPLGMVKVPARKYIHQGLKPWLGRLLSREGMEKIACEHPRAMMTQVSTEVTDIWQGEVFRNLKETANSDTAFFPGPPGELRLAFSFSVDGFHPFGMKPAKQNASSTGIWLVLLNLPWHLRYRPENIYLAGVIPGPNKPSNDQINHYMQLIVNDFQELHTGIRFSRTNELREGRTCRGMLIPLVSDLLSAHQVIGYPGAPTAHYFCTCCDLDIDDINVTNRDEWPKKDLRHIRRYAQIYRDAESERHQQSVFEACGWRWSPLFELEYWDPSLHTAIDSMHALDLNLFSNHSRNLFQIDTLPGHNRGEALRPPTQERVKRVIAVKSEVKSLRKCQDVIYEDPPDLLYHLLKFHRRILYSFCLDYKIQSAEQSIVTGTRWILAKGIHKWRQNQRSESVQTFLHRYPSLSPQQLALMEEEDPRTSDGDDDLEEEEFEGDKNEEPQEDDRGRDTDEEGQPLIGPSGAESESEDQPAGPILPAPPKPKVLRRNALKLLEYVDGDSDNDKPLFDKITVVILEHFYNVLSLDSSEAKNVETSNKKVTVKRRLFDFIVNTLKTDNLKKAHLHQHFSETAPVVASSAAFLGVDVMEEVWKDMARTRLPSWITPAPRDWGTSRRGKLSADNWRIISCVHLPITLLRLFGNSEGRTHDVVDNFMQLVSAVRIATMWTSSPAHVEAYNQVIFSYTRGVLRLYPDYSVLPSHHASLHIGDMLQRFGPKHSHDSPYYERYIRFFHRMNTNGKLGEVEGTFLRTAMRNANLLALLEDSVEDRQLVQSVLHRLSAHKKEGLRGYRLTEAVSLFSQLAPDHDPELDARLAMDAAREKGGTLSRVDPDIFPLLCSLLHCDPADSEQDVSPHAIFLDAISLRNNLYAIWNSRKYNDSRILFMHDRVEKAGVIQAIFVHQHREPSSSQYRTKTYLAIDTYARVDGADRFSGYSNAGGFCCKPDPTSKTVITLEDVLSHVALTEFVEEGVIHILPINRTMLALETGQSAHFGAQPPSEEQAVST